MEIMSPLEQEIATFEESRAQLEASAMGKWVLVHDSEVIGTFDSFDAAADRAVREFGEGPYLIRQIGSSSLTLPASVVFNLA
jgi:hypothetical protein